MRTAPRPRRSQTIEDVADAPTSQPIPLRHHSARRRTQTPPVRPVVLATPSAVEPSAFTGRLLRSPPEKGLERPCAEFCVPRPDGNIVRHLSWRNEPMNPDRACCHTDHQIVDGDVSYGMIGGAVGAFVAVLIAEELFASGRTLLVSVTSLTGSRDTETP